MSWNLSSDEEDDFENWANARHQEHVAAAAAKGGEDSDFSSEDDDDDDRKPAAAIDSAALTLPSDFDLLPSTNNNDYEEEESDDDVDWEDAAEDGQPPEADTTAAAASASLPPGAKLPTTAVTLELGTPGDKKDSSKSKNDRKRKRGFARKVFRYNQLPPRLQGFLKNLQKVHLLSLSGHAIFASHYASNQQVLHVAHSLIPTAWLSSSSKTQSVGPSGVVAPSVPDLTHFLGWFTDFTRSKKQSGSWAAAAAGSSNMRGGWGRRGSRSRGGNSAKKKASKRYSGGVMDSPNDPTKTSIHYRLLDYCAELAAQRQQRDSASTSLGRMYNEYDAIFLFLAMARSMGWRARYVIAMDSIPQDLDVDHPVFGAMSNLNIFLTFWNASNKMKKTNTKAASNPISLVESDEEPKKPPAKRAKKMKSGSGKKGKTPPQRMPEKIDDEAPSKLLCWVEVLCSVPESGKPRNATANEKSRSSSSRSLQWVHVDPILGLVDRPNTVESIFYAYHQQKARGDISRKRQPIPYAVAVEHLSVSNTEDPPLLRMTDVTRRYAFSMVETLRTRGSGEDNSVEKYFANLLRQNSSHGKKPNQTHSTAAMPSSPDSQGKSSDDAIVLYDTDEKQSKKPPAVTPDPVACQAAANPFDHDGIEEELELKANAKMEPLPTSKAAFKKHPTYVLRSNLNATEVLRPDARKRTCGMFKGEFVFLRSDVETALPEKKWLYKGRKVKDSGLKTPILKIKARKKPQSRSFKALKSYGVGEDNDGSAVARAQTIEDASQPLNDGKQHLYASWQTDPWSPAPVGPNDEIPVNEYNNVELELLNPGLVHIDKRGISKTAKKLSIPYKPCLLGFEGHGGNRTPTIRGIVVHAHNETLLREAHVELESHLEQQEEDNRRKSILRKWHRLMAGVLTKDRLEREYGDDDE